MKSPSPAPFLMSLPSPSSKNSLLGDAGETGSLGTWSPNDPWSLTATNLAAQPPPLYNSLGHNGIGSPRESARRRSVRPLTVLQAETQPRIHRASRDAQVRLDPAAAELPLTPAPDPARTVTVSQLRRVPGLSDAPDQNHTNCPQTDSATLRSPHPAGSSCPDQARRRRPLRNRARRRPASQTMPARPQTPRLRRAAAGAQPPASRAGHRAHPGAAAGAVSRLGRRGTHHRSRAPLRTAPGVGPRSSGCAAAWPRRRARLPAGERGFGAESRGGGPSEGPMVGRRARAGQPITPGGRPFPRTPSPLRGFPNP